MPPQHCPQHPFELGCGATMHVPAMGRQPQVGATTPSSPISWPEALDGVDRRSLQGLARQYLPSQAPPLSHLACSPPRVLPCVLQATDVYAVGVLLWEMFHCSRAWPGMSFADIVQAVAVQQRRLHCSPDMPLLFKVSQLPSVGLTPHQSAAAVLAANCTGC